MTDTKRLSKNLVLAIDWAAAEYKYLEDLKVELKKVEAEKEIKKELKELRKAAKILHYVARAERRAYQFEETVHRGLVELLPELQQEGISADLILGFRDLATELGIEHDQLAKMASFYEGTLDKELDKAKVEAIIEQQYKQLRGVNFQQAQHMRQVFLEMVHHFSSQVEDAERWVAGLATTLKKAQALLEKLPKDRKKLIQEEARQMLMKKGFPVKKFPQATACMVEHYNDLLKIWDVAKDLRPFYGGKNMGGLFWKLAQLGIIDEKHWQGIVDVTLALFTIDRHSLSLLPRSSPQVADEILRDGIFHCFQETGLLNTAYWSALALHLIDIFKLNLLEMKYGFEVLYRTGFFTAEHWQNTVLELKKQKQAVGEEGLGFIFWQLIKVLVVAKIVTWENWHRCMPGLIELYQKCPDRNILRTSLIEFTKSGQITEETFPLFAKVLANIFTIIGRKFPQKFTLGFEIAISFKKRGLLLTEEQYLLMVELVLRILTSMNYNSIKSAAIEDLALTLLRSGLITEEHEVRLAKYLSGILSYCKGVEARTYKSLAGCGALFTRFGMDVFELLIIPTLKRQSVASYLCFEDYARIQFTSSENPAIKTEQDISFLVTILSKRKFKAHNFFHRILHAGLEKGVIAVPLSQEKEYLLPFLDNCSVDVLEAYLEYKGLCQSVHPQKEKYLQIFFKNMKTIRQDVFNGVLTKNYEANIFLGVVYGTFSPELRVSRSDYQEAYENRMDRDIDIPSPIKKLSPEVVHISRGGYALKEGETINDQVWRDLVEVVAEVNSKGAEKVVPELLGLELLEAFFTKQLAKERKEYLRKIYAYWHQLGNGLPEFNADHTTLMKYKEFIGDRLKNDLISSLLDAAYTKQQKQFIDLIARFEKPKNFTGLAKQLFSLWSSQRADKEERIRAILQQNGLRAEKLDWQVQKWQDIAQWLEQKAAGTISKDLISNIFAMLIGEDYSKMQREMDKFEHSHQATGKGGRKFIFMLSKKKVHSVAMFNMGVCVAPDDELWNSPDFWQLIIWDEDFHAHGGVIYRTIEEGGRKYLVLSIQPASTILSDVSPVHLYDQLIAFSEKMRKNLGYDQILIPTDSGIHSNRGSIQAVISQRNYPKKELLHKYDFSYSPYHYEYQEFFMVS